MDKKGKRGKSKKRNSQSQRSKVKPVKVNKAVNFSNDIIKILKRIDSRVLITKESMAFLNEFLVDKMRGTIKLANQVRKENSKRKRVNASDLEAALKLQCRNTITKNMIAEGNFMAKTFLEQKRNKSTAKKSNRSGATEA